MPGRCISIPRRGTQDGGPEMQRKYTPRDISRFWSKIDQREDPDSCWDWRASFGTTGYGQIRWNGTTEKAHRVAWELTHGERPTLCVLHRCDNRSCCNPTHLFLGTRTDNSDDMYAKHRSAWGERSSHAKLTLPQILEIRRIFVRGHPELGDKALSARFGCSPRTIRDIVNRHSWRHV